jgi:transcriptional regulator with XRE-family HTH domain
MTTLVHTEGAVEQTSALGALLRTGAIGIALLGTGMLEQATASTYPLWIEPDSTISGPSGQLPAGLAQDTWSSASAILEIRRRSGLTWDELAKLFEVSRRSVHHWASGKPVSASHHRQIWRMLTAIRHVDQGEAARTRDFLLAADASGNSPLDLLSLSRFEEATARVGTGRAPVPATLTPLSESALRARRPASPASLLDASQDRPATPAKARVAAAVRVPRTTD